VVKTFNKLALTAFSVLMLASLSGHAQTLAVCASAASDSDGDGFGWENNKSCRVSGNAAPTSSSDICQSANSDPDGDGWGWENGKSCKVDSGSSAPTNPSSSTPTCLSAASDPDGDGYGWENNKTCLADSSSSPTTSPPTAPATALASCESTASDSDGDGFGWEDGRSCIVTASTGNPAPTQPAVTPPVVTAPTAPTGGGLPRSSSLPTVATASDTTDYTGGDRFATRQVGDFQLMQNAWRAWRAADGYEWTQTIYTNTNGAPIGWNYDWGPGVPGANNRASDDYYVRSYPELIFGVKDEYRTSAPKAIIGLPVRVDSIPNFTIDYAYDAPESGPARTVDASVNTRFPNGTTINGERNVAVESFFYDSVNGVCDDNTPVTRDGGSNHVYEVMLWLDSGAERLPAAPNDYVTDITLRGAEYGVYTKSNDPRYIAFVARNPQTTGTIYWNDFVDWARINAHTVKQQFGANANSQKIEDSWCMANIIMGTEIFWGKGDFNLYEWTITQSQ